MGHCTAPLENVRVQGLGLMVQGQVCGFDLGIFGVFSNGRFFFPQREPLTMSQSTALFSCGIMGKWLLHTVHPFSSLFNMLTSSHPDCEKKKNETKRRVLFVVRLPEHLVLR